MLPKILVLFAFLCSIIIPIMASRILAIVPMPTYSHQTFYRKIWIELSRRGHQVTLITTDPMKDPRLVNITEIDVHGTYEVKQKHITKIGKMGRFEMVHASTNAANGYIDYQLSQKEVKALLNKKTKFDAVITESLFFEYLALGDYFDCAKILVSSLDLRFSVHGYLGNPMNPIATPDFFLPFVSSKLSFYERVYSYFYQTWFLAHYFLHTGPTRREIFKKHLGEEVREPLDILMDTDLTLINTNPIINDIRPIGPNVIPFGGGINILPLKPLPKEFKEYLDSAKEGFIYFSLGTNSKSAAMPPEKIQVILETLSEIPYKVLWKFETEGLIDPPKNVKLMPWIPQQDVLRHPNIKLFVTQAGLQSLEEAILNNVPMVMLPMYADQDNNAYRMQDRGFGRVVPHMPKPDKEEFKSILLDVIRNPKYKQNVVKAAELILDQPMAGVDKAVWWIEYALRHRGAKHLRNPAVDIPFYQYYGLDILATLFAILFVVFSGLACAFKSICGKSKPKETISKKKKQ